MKIVERWTSILSSPEENSRLKFSSQPGGEENSRLKFSSPPKLVLLSSLKPFILTFFFIYQQLYLFQIKLDLFQIKLDLSKLQLDLFNVKKSFNQIAYLLK